MMDGTIIIQKPSGLGPCISGILTSLGVTRTTIRSAAWARASFTDRMGLFGSTFRIPSPAGWRSGRAFDGICIALIPRWRKRLCWLKEAMGRCTLIAVVLRRDIRAAITISVAGIPDGTGIVAGRMSTATSAWRRVFEKCSSSRALRCMYLPPDYRNDCWLPTVMWLAY